MVINDFQADLKAIMKQQDMFQEDIAKKIGKSQQQVSRVVKQKQFNDSFVAVLDALGYDIKVVYVRNDKVIKK